MNFEGVMGILRRTIDMSDAGELDIARLRRRSECVRYWLDGFAPDMIKFSVCKTMPDVQLSSDEKSFFETLAMRLDAWDAESINKVILETAKESPLGTKKGFQALYKILIGKTAGPRLGSFLESMDKDFVIARLKEVSL